MGGFVLFRTGFPPDSSAVKVTNPRTMPYSIDSPSCEEKEAFMNHRERENYLYQKKCLLILFFLYHQADVPFDAITLRSFGFHFDPTCNFKVIVHSQHDHYHKYVVHIYDSNFGLNYVKVDVMGNVNFVYMENIYDNREDLYSPEASLNVYYDGQGFFAKGYIEGKQSDFSSFDFDKKGDFVSDLIAGTEFSSLNSKNKSAPTFLLWLMRLFNSKLHSDLVMGAGINADYGAQDWKGLLAALSTEFYNGNAKTSEEVRHYVGQELFTNSMVIKTSGFDMYKTLSHELYEFKEAKSFNDPDSTLYRCVDYLSSHPGTTVITYNYDTNLEYLMKKRNLRYCTIYDENSFVTKDSVSDIYHVHGLLPYKKNGERKFTDSLIFNESDYYYLYNNPYSWNIAKQLHDFKFNTCLFIGISLTDPDMKRILSLAKNYLKFNFIFLKKEKGYSEQVYKYITLYFFTFDLLILWIDEYEEIGEVLKEI